MKVGIYGFMCGVSLLLSGNTINFWLASYNIDAKVIGLLSLVVMPYVFKFIIAIFISKYKIFHLSNRIGNNKAWLIVAQILISIILFTTGFLSPEKHISLVALSGFLIAFFAVIQDIILNSNRIKILSIDQQYTGTAMYAVGYRIGMLCCGSGVIMASTYIDWKFIYFSLSILYILFTISAFFIYEELQNSSTILSNNSSLNIYKLLIQPLYDFWTSNQLTWIIFFILFYRISDYMLVVMLNPFFLHLGYSALEIATISKFFGVVMVIIGSVISGPIIKKINIRNSLIIFSAIHILGNCLFMVLSTIGKNIPLLYFIVAYESLTSGMMMTAYFAFISQLCRDKYTAERYALLSSGMGLSRAIFPVFSGLIVDYYSWMIFFAIITLISILTTYMTILSSKYLIFDKT
jgi:MFS transporter, PAT family, beta-lactamase induction signal transducer AmpG